MEGDGREAEGGAGSGRGATGPRGHGPVTAVEARLRGRDGAQCEVIPHVPRTRPRVVKSAPPPPLARWRCRRPVRAGGVRRARGGPSRPTCERGSSA
eukprot:5030005-Prymnesium_polylepis.1